VITLVVIGIAGTLASMSGAAVSYPPTTTTTTLPAVNDPTISSSASNPVEVRPGDQEVFTLEEYCPSTPVKVVFDGIDDGITIEVDSNGVLTVSVVWLVGHVSIDGSTPIPDHPGLNVMAFDGCIGGHDPERDAYFFLPGALTGSPSPTTLPAVLGVTRTGATRTRTGVTTTTQAGGSPRPGSLGRPPLPGSTTTPAVMTAQRPWWPISLAAALLLGLVTFLLARWRWMTDPDRLATGGVEGDDAGEGELGPSSAEDR
jgi:hypothetical protein